MKKTSLIFLSAILVLGLAFVGYRAYAADSTQPVVTTTSTPNGGSSVDVAFPSGYSGEVTSTFDGTKWNTVTKPLSAADQAAIAAQIQKQQADMDQLFAQEQAFWNQQQQLMDNFWKDFRY